jgi:hypothetical protein
MPKQIFEFDAKEIGNMLMEELVLSGRVKMDEVKGDTYTIRLSGNGAKIIVKLKKG